MTQAKIQFYGAPMSSAGRTQLMLEECGVAYDYHRVNVREPAARDELLKVNPGGKIPFLIDGDLRLPESVAINFYLAEKYAPQLWAQSAEERAQIYAWSLWGITNFQPECLRVMRHMMMLPESQRSATELEHGKAAVKRYLDELEAALTGSYLCCGRYTVADVNVGSIVNLALATVPDLVGPRTKAWLAGLKDRPAWKKAAAGQS